MNWTPEGGDVDYFAFEGLIPGLNYVAEVVGGPVDTILGLFDETGALIDVDDDSGSGVLSTLIIQRARQKPDQSGRERLQ